MSVDDEVVTSENNAIPRSVAASGSSETSSGPDASASPNPLGPAGNAARGRRVIIASVIVILLLVVAALGYVLWQAHRQDELRHSAAEDASRLVVQLATYDHPDVDANLDAVVAEATPGFADRYREVSEGLRDLLASGEGTSKGTVSHAAVESVDGDTAVVLVFLDQEVTNVTVPEGRVDSSRMVVTVVRDGDRWLLDDAQLA